MPRGNCATPLHISIPRILLKRKPAAKDRTKNSQIQFHSKPAKATFRDGYCTSISSIWLFSCSAGSPETKIRFQNFPRRRTGDNRDTPEPTTTLFVEI